MKLIANVTAMALATALVGGASAQGIGNGGGLNSPPPGQVSPLGAGAVGAGGSTQLFAVINPDGSIARDKGVISSARVGGGAYEVIFARDIRNCVYTATIGNPQAGNPDRGFIVTALRAGTTNGVFINTADPSDVLTDRGFHLWVNC